MVASFFVGLGPGSPFYIASDLILPAAFFTKNCLPGSSHGGNVPLSRDDFGALAPFLQVGDSYDKENLVTFLGGSGGDAINSISVFLFL